MWESSPVRIPMSSIPVWAQPAWSCVTGLVFFGVYHVIRSICKSSYRQCSHCVASVLQISDFCSTFLLSLIWNSSQVSKKPWRLFWSIQAGDTARLWESLRYRKAMGRTNGEWDAAGCPGVSSWSSPCRGFYDWQFWGSVWVTWMAGSEVSGMKAFVSD